MRRPHELAALSLLAVLCACCAGASEERTGEPSGRVEDLQREVAELREVLGRSRHAGAETGTELARLQHQVMALEGQLAELRHQLHRQGESERQRQSKAGPPAKVAGVRAPGPLDASRIPPDADAHYAAAERAYERRYFDRARALYRAFLARHGSDARADDARYRIGASHLEENHPGDALRELRRVIHDHPRGDAADDALQAMAEAFFALRACRDARSALHALIRQHPRSPLVARARTRLEEIRRAPPGECGH